MQVSAVRFVDPIPLSLFSLPDETPHESVECVADKASGLRAIVAIHNSARGPAFGGCRMYRYPSDTAALVDAQRLSQGMSLKNALADLPFGGGKSVILLPNAPFDRTALFRAFGRAIERLNGRYITAEDVGTTTSDMLTVGQHTRYVSGIAREDGRFGGDPSPKTAWGVFVAIDEAVKTVLGRGSLDGVRVAVQGLGAVGASLCGFLYAAGARLIVADVRSERVEEMVVRYGAVGVSTEQILSIDAEVFSPCAMGAILTSQTVNVVRAAIVAGAANNQLADPSVDILLQERGIIYIPDFLVNAGGIVSVAREYLGGAQEATVLEEVGRIRLRVAELLARMTSSGDAPNSIAIEWAHQKLHLA